MAEVAVTPLGETQNVEKQRINIKALPKEESDKIKRVFKFRKYLLEQVRLGDDAVIPESKLNELLAVLSKPDLIYVACSGDEHLCPSCFSPGM